MKKLIVIALLLITSLTQAQVTVDWFNYPGGVAVATDVSNNVYTANWDYNNGGDITLTKRDVTGNFLWNAFYDNTDFTRHEVATWVEVDNAGNILVSGTIRSGYANPANAASLLMKFNSSGLLLWRVVYESSSEGSSTKKCLVDANDNIYVLGIGTGPGGQVTKVKKFNPSGASVWNYFDSGIGAPVTFKFTPDNNIVIVHRGVTGIINGYSKIDLNGTFIWTLGGFNSPTIGDAAGDTEGNTYIINGENVQTNAGSVLTKLSPTGNVIWSRTNTMKGNKVEVGTDDNPVIGGYPNVGYGTAFMKYDNNGNVIWQNLDADGPALAFLALTPMKLDGSNAAYIAGSTMSSMGVCKVNSDGSSAWAATTPSGYPVDIDFGTDNSVFITGGQTARLVQTSSSAPAPPSNLTAVSGGVSVINLSWVDNSTDETGFVLQRSLTSGSGFSTITTLPANSVSFSNTGLNSSTTYYYRVQAVNSGGGSPWSNTASASTDAYTTSPAAPSNLFAEATDCNSITLTWVDNSTNEESFDLRRSTKINGTYLTIVTLPANTSAYTNTGLTTGQKYYYKVRAANPIGNSDWSNIARIKVSCQTITGKENSAQIPEQSQQSIKLFPNPSTNGVFQLSLPEKTIYPVTLKIHALTGQLVLQKELNGYNNTIITKGLTNGTYIISIISNSHIEKMKLQIAR